MSKFPGLRAAIHAVRTRYEIDSNDTGTEIHVREVVGSDVVIVATFPARDSAAVDSAVDEADAWIDDAIARAVVEFARSPAAMDRVDAALGSLGDRIDEEADAIIRAALGEETTDAR